MDFYKPCHDPPPLTIIHHEPPPPTTTHHHVCTETKQNEIIFTMASNEQCPKKDMKKKVVGNWH